MTSPVTLYFAGPLFTQGEWSWNAATAAGLRAHGFEVILPQETAEALSRDGEPFDGQAIFAANVAGIEQCDAVVAVLDGADPDSGTCWECGYAFHSGKPVIGVRTDFRQAGDDPGTSLNLMLSRSCSTVIELPMRHRSDRHWLLTQITNAVRQCVPPASSPL